MQITALGPLSIDGRTVEGSRLPALLLPLLLARGRIVSVARLVEAVWDGTPPADPLGALQALVTRARRLGLTVTATAGGYRLDPDGLDVDLVAAQDLLARARAALGAGDPSRAAADAARAIALWPGGDPAAVAEPVGRLYRDVVSLGVEAGLASGAGLDPAAVDRLRDAVRHLPTDEPLVVLLMRGLAANGQEAAALAVYAQLREDLREAYGTDPSALVARTHLALLRGELGGFDAAGGFGTVGTADELGTVSTSGPSASELADPRSTDTATSELPPRPALSSVWRRQMTPLVGRDTDVLEIELSLQVHPLVTLVAVGGAGKTRLAAEVAARAARQGVPVHAVELAGVRDPAEVLPALLTMLGAAESTSDGPDPRTRRVLDPQERILRATASLRGLLVLDNCEHLLEAAADVAALVLETAEPGVRILATSRAPLGVVGEAVHPVATLSDDAALTLLESRGRTVRPGLAWDPAIALELCHRLDNLPLAIELAAARLRSLTLGDVLAGVDHRFTLLTGALRGLPDRHRGLWAMVDWSWALLDQRSRALLRDLAVIPTPFDVDTALAVAGLLDDTDAREGLAVLVEQSLLILEEPGDGRAARFRMLETVREYGDTRLTEEGVRDDVMGRLVRWAAGRGRSLREGYVGTGQLAALATTAENHDTLTVSLRWAVEHDEKADAFAIAADLFTAWTLRGLHLEVLGWTRLLLQCDDRAARRATWQLLQAPSGAATPDPDDVAVVAAVTIATSAITHDRRLGALAMRLARWALTGAPNEGRLSHRSRAIATVAIAVPAWPRDHGAAAVDTLVTDPDPYLHAMGLYLRAAYHENEGDLVSSGQDARAAYTVFEFLDDSWGMGIAAQSVSQVEAGLDAALSDVWLTRAIDHLDRIGAVRDAGTLVVTRDVRRALHGSGEAAAALEATLRAPSSTSYERAQAGIGLGALAAARGDWEDAVVHADLAVRAVRDDTLAAPQARIMTEVAGATLRIRAGLDGEALLGVAARAALPLGDMPVVGAVAQGYAQLAASRGLTTRADELWALGVRLGSGLGLVLGSDAGARPAPGGASTAAADDGARTAPAPDPSRITAAEALARLTTLIEPV